ncbi:MAG: Sir2 family NAD-dependent protein deacetylase [Bacteroidota bacterium]|nr:Sir2 family NAD-dependent protein deacetylase [Bacteroidota bacterium]
MSVKLNKLVVLTGAGISAESGLKTFRDSGGLWEEHDVNEVCSIEGWYRNPKVVLDFYNDRRRQLKDAQPNGAHMGLAELQKDYDVHIITQNIDNLHERAGSLNVLHLHGEMTKACSSRDKGNVIDIGYQDIQVGDKAKDGSQLRPFIVWFGEAVPAMEDAIRLTSEADIFLVIGTSLNVYPAAGLVDYVPSSCQLYLIDPNHVGRGIRRDCRIFQENAVKGIQLFRQALLSHQAV